METAFAVKIKFLIYQNCCDWSNNVRPVQTRFQANLPIGESLISFEFAMSMCLLWLQSKVCEFDSIN